MAVDMQLRPPDGPALPAGGAERAGLLRQLRERLADALTVRQVRTLCLARAMMSVDERSRAGRPDHQARNAAAIPDGRVTPAGEERQGSPPQADRPGPPERVQRVR